MRHLKINIGKKIIKMISFVFFSVIFFSTPCKAGFTITLKVENCKKELKAYLVSSMRGLKIQHAVDSSELNNGAFTLKGDVGTPRVLTILLAESPQQINLSTPTVCLFVENSDIKINTDALSIPKYTVLPNYPYDKIKITGSISQSLLEDFYKKMSSYNASFNPLHANYISYLNASHTSSSHYVAEGINLVRPLDSIRLKTHDYILNFINKNKDNPVAVFVALKHIYRFSKQESEGINKLLLQYQKPTSELKELTSKIQQQNLSALGSNYSDYILKDTSGNDVSLATYITGKKKYVLLEFWASWCSPCRADFPHLKIAYDLYKSSGFEVIAISMDDNKDNWKKAIKDDDTKWVQLINPEGFRGKNLKSLYNFDGIPTSILIDTDGKIVNLNMRGSWMDKDLIKVFGNKFGDLY